MKRILVTIAAFMFLAAVGATAGNFGMYAPQDMTSGGTITGTITFDGVDPDMTVTSGENIDMTLVGTSYFDVNQGADDTGIRVFGYDDRVASNIRLSIDQFGNGEITSAGLLGFYSSGNSNILSSVAGTGDYDYRTDADSTFQVGDGTYSWTNSPEFGVEGVAEFDEKVYIDSGLEIANDVWHELGSASNYLQRWDTNGTGDSFLVNYFNDGATDSLTMAYVKGINPANTTDFDTHESPTLALLSVEGADANDYSGVLIGSRATADVAVDHYFDFFATTGDLDGAVDATTTEKPPNFRFGDAGTATFGNADGEGGDVLFEDEVEIDGDLYADSTVVVAGATSSLTFSNTNASIDGYTGVLSLEDGVVQVGDDGSGCATDDGDGDLCVEDELEVEGNLQADGALILPAGTIAADDVTPSVSGAKYFTTSANTGATAITDLDDPIAGQEVCIVGGSNTNSSTIADSGNFNLSAAWTASLDDVLCLYVQADNDYVEISRVDN